ncbi:MAG: hypothetical protein LBC76_08250 [Treponema sp.]|jgi:hypothetical protein|nr:hypothetical protein [Treponema sp.]
MMEIPIGKAFMAVENNDTTGKSCSICELYDYCDDIDDIACRAKERKDGKNVIFKLVDYSERANEQTQN